MANRKGEGLFQHVSRQAEVLGTDLAAEVPVIRRIRQAKVLGAGRAVVQVQDVVGSAEALLGVAPRLHPNRITITITMIIVIIM